LVTSQEIFFAATGITPGTLLDGVEYHGNQAKTHSLVIRGETGTRRMIHTHYGQFSEVIDTISNPT
jgi:fructose-1,6-bisphosphatase II